MASCLSEAVDLFGDEIAQLNSSEIAPVPAGLSPRLSDAHGELICRHGLSDHEF
jgi:hypothetical protein